MTRPIDKLGRVVLPIELRRAYDMVDGLVEIISTDKGLLLAPYELRCGVCGSMDDVQEHRGGLICAECIGFFKRLGSGNK